MTVKTSVRSPAIAKAIIGCAARALSTSRYRPQRTISPGGDVTSTGLPRRLTGSSIRSRKYSAGRKAAAIMAASVEIASTPSQGLASWKPLKSRAGDTKVCATRVPREGASG
jgi:hypothetical protein